MRNIPETLSNRLSMAMERKKITIKDVNDKSGLSKATVNHWLAMDRGPNLFSVVEVAKVLGVSIDWLVGRTEQMTLKKEEDWVMNMRQSMRAMAKQMEDLENYNRRAKHDIKAYNACIDGMIAGKSPCGWCEEYNECQLQAKDGKGCSEWWLADQEKAMRQAPADSAEDGPVSGVMPK